jgi:hypothetical protein
MAVLSLPVWCALGVAWLLAGAAAAQPPSAQEYQVKAAFLYNFAKFVEWPDEGEGRGGELIIAVFGRDPFGDVLEQTVEGKAIRSHPLVVRRPARLGELKSCHVLFISTSETSRLPQILQALGDARVLTVSEMAGFLEAGGMIHFLVEENRVRFDINAAAARRAGIAISSKLLTLARAVREQR